MGLFACRAMRCFELVVIDLDFSRDYGFEVMEF
jgi:hypothetical protein